MSLRPTPLLLVLLLLTACTPDAGSAVDDATDDAADVAETADDNAADVPPEDIWPDGDWVPDDIKQLYGYWRNDDGETVRDLQFDQFDLFDADMHDVSPVYWLYSYPKGKAKVLIERGRATLSVGPKLHLERVWSDDVTLKGTAYDLTFLAAAPKTFAFATGTSGARVYTNVW